MRFVCVMSSLAVALMLTACGSDSGDGSGGGTGTTGGSGGGGTGPASWQTVGSCVVDATMCMTFECDANAGSICANMNAGSESGCNTAGGTWTAGAACTLDKAVGTCTEVPSSGMRTSTTYYEGQLTAADLEEMCTSKQGTWALP